VGNGYGVCSNWLRTSRDPPASHDHFNHCEQCSNTLESGADGVTALSGVATGGGNWGDASPHLSQGPIVGFVQIR